MGNTLTQAGLALIKSFEGFRSSPYQDEGGVWTIGYGHTHGVTAGTPSMTEPEAAGVLEDDLTQFGGYIGEYIKVPLNDNQFSALVSLTENCGTAPLSRTLGIKLNAGDFRGAADEFLKWRLVDGMVNDGLMRRREAERELFLAPVEEPATHNID